MNYWQRTLALCIIDLTSILTSGGWLFVHTVEQEIIGTTPRPRHRHRYHHLFQFRFFQRLWGPLPDEDLDEIEEVESEPNIGQGNGHVGWLEDFFPGEIPTQTDWWHEYGGPGQPLEGSRD